MSQTVAVDKKTPERTMPTTVVLVTTALLVASWCLAEWPLLAAVDTLVEAEAVNLGGRILVAGALPWALQWAALAMVAYSVLHRFGWRRVDAAGVALVPLAYAIPWWCGIASIYWSVGAMEAVLRTLTDITAQRWGGLSFGRDVVFNVFGPLTSPLTLRGPISLEGIQAFATTLASTAVIMMAVGAFCQLLRSVETKPAGQRLRWRVAVLVGGALVLNIPVALRLLLRAN